MRFGIAGWLVLALAAAVQADDKRALSAGDLPVSVIKNAPFRDAATAEGIASAAATAVLSPDDQLLEALLGRADLFFKRTFNVADQRWEYNVVWSENGDAAPMVIYLRNLGNRADGTKIPLVYCWTQVAAATAGQKIPPAVATWLAEANDDLPSGNLSIAAGGVYANAGIVMQSLSPESLWLHLWNLQHTRRFAKPEVERLMKGG